MSLAGWERGGLLDREAALYHELKKRGFTIDFVTYGGPEDLALEPRLEGIKVLCNRWRLHHRLYRFFLPLLHAGSLRQAGVIKTNQTDGALVALRAARLWGKPLVARSGYPFSTNAARIFGEDSAQARRARAVERKVWSAAWRVVVTTRAMAEKVVQSVPAAGPRTFVIPNYVDTERFCPGPGDGGRKTDLIFVGRLSPEKNLRILVEAIRPLSCTLKIIGQGQPDPELGRGLADLGSRLEWLPMVPNGQLPGHLRSSRVFCLPSRFEGHPKALIEAMAAGLGVVGTDVPGIREVIQDGVTGLLSPAEPGAFGRAVQRLLADREYRAGLGRAARAFVMANYDLDRVAALEAELYREIEV